MASGIAWEQFSADLLNIDAATSKLMTSIATISDDQVAAASRLPDWTVGHCLAHIARNADGIVNLVTWAVTGERTPMYPSMQVRDSDIERDSRRGADVLREDVAASAARLATAMSALANAGVDALERLVIFGAPPPSTPPNTPAHQLGFARLREVQIHHADLGLADFSYEDFDDDFVTRTLNFIEDRSGPVEVTGPNKDVLVWRLGRGTPTSLRDENGDPAGAPPAW